MLSTQSPLPDDNDEAFARLTAYEFAIEVILANMTANMRPDYSEAFKADLVRVSKKPYGLITGDPEGIRRLQAISARIAVIAEHLIEKVASREKEIRARLPQGQ